MFVSVLVFLALLAVVAVQTVENCIHAGYDLSSLTGSDLLYTAKANPYGAGPTYSWAIRPCGAVTTAGFCLDQPGEFCQGNVTVSVASNQSTALWGQTSVLGQVGVAQYLEDGTVCPSGVYPSQYRQGTIVYLCNATATTPFISSVTIAQETSCHYQAIIQAAALCPQVPPSGVSSALGTSVISPLCGGGIYDLSRIDYVDIVGVAGNATWFIHPCGALATQPNGCNNSASSVCRVDATSAVSAAEYTPLLELPTFYQYLAPQSVNQIQQTGDLCGTPPQQRLTNISFQCNASAVTPVLVSAVEVEPCHYWLTVQTSVTCGAAFSIPPLATAQLCFMTYSLPYTVDYPWSTALSLTVQYNPALALGPQGLAYQIASGNGTRTFTNRFGAQSSVNVSVAGTPNPYGVPHPFNNLVYLAGSPVDAQGLLLSTSAFIHQPGSGPVGTVNALFVEYIAGAVREYRSFSADPAGQVWQATIPGYTNNLGIGASNVNALAVNATACQAPITFINGLRPPTQPSTSNGATRFYYNYQVSDGATYSVQTNLTIGASSFAATADALGNPYQSITTITGTRTYTYLPTGQVQVYNVTSKSIAAVATGDGVDTTPSQRFYPYSLLAATPGVYTQNTAPFIDNAGIEFMISPGAPPNGLPPSQNATVAFRLRVQLFVLANETLNTAWLTEDYTLYPSLVAYQQQMYSLAV